MMQLWLVLAVLQAALSIWLVHSTQHWPSATLLALVAWGGAGICLEDVLPTLQLRPSWPSLGAGLLLLAYATWRSAATLDQDTLVYALPLLQGIGLALMATSIRTLGRFRAPLVVLSLFPLQLLLARALPEAGLSQLTARITQIGLALFGADAAVSGRLVILGNSSVEITGACNSIDLIAQLTMIATVFVLAFPIRSRLVKACFVSTAPFVAISFNAARIALLAGLNSSSLADKEKIFTFLHDQWGALVFAGVATVCMGQLYYSLINRELNTSSRHNKS